MSIKNISLVACRNMVLTNLKQLESFNKTKLKVGFIN